ncbi:MAG: hypothetical protein H0W88_08730 [Parachlamydiaceae bacterium]|nr:hypothetical protein [Parachlamydiaceae bacterium]
MNILSLVFAVLLILGLFTNLQFENFKQFHTMKSEYENFIKVRERENFNTRQQALYKYRSKKDPGERSDNLTESKKSSPRINIRLILDPKLRAEKKAESDQQKLLMKELIKVLYQNAIFYTKIEETRPDFLDELIEAIINAAKDRNIKFIQEIGTLQLNDDELQLVFYQMMNGSQQIPSLDEPVQPQQVVVTENTTRDPNEEVDEEDADVSEDENRSPSDYLSLKDFFHFKPSLRKIQVYLARKELLIAIFGDQNTALEVINKREELFARKGKLITDEATNKLTEFKKQINPQFKEDLFDFKVTGTNPKNYR